MGVPVEVRIRESGFRFSMRRAAPHWGTSIESMSSPYEAETRTHFSPYFFFSAFSMDTSRCKGWPMEMWTTPSSRASVSMRDTEDRENPTCLAICAWLSPSS